MERVSRLFGRHARQRDERELSHLQAASREQSVVTGPLRLGAAVRGNTVTAMDTLLQSREEDLRARAAPNTDFTPTLPMDGE